MFKKEEFIQILRDYHPIAKQAELLLQQGERTVQSARGGFDPKIEGAVDQKYYDDKSYYRLFDGGLKVPTWYGIELKTGVENNSGQFLKS